MNLKQAKKLRKLVKAIHPNWTEEQQKHMYKRAKKEVKRGSKVS
jgi:hypothetical protein